MGAAGVEVAAHNPSHILSDIDRDGLDHAEITLLLTSPANANTDTDGLSGHLEVLITKSHPKHVNTDSHGYTDEVEPPSTAKANQPPPPDPPRPCPVN